MNKPFNYFIMLSILISCNDDKAINPEEFCTETEVSISCERPATQEIEITNALLKTYTSNAYKILNTYLDGCFETNEEKIKTINSYITIYGTQGSLKDSILSLNTIVHELTHAISGRYTDANASYCETKQVDKIWINGQNEKHVNIKALFPAKEILKSLIPVVTNSIYTDQYIKNESSATQNLGAYALLNEFNAYYQGIFTAFESFGAYNDLYQKTSDFSILQNFIIQFENEVSSYYIFKYYIVLYIDYAKKNHTKDYENLKNNTEFWEAFYAVDREFSLLILNYKKLLQDNPTLNSESSFDQVYNSQYKLIEEEIEKLI